MNSLPKNAKGGRQAADRTPSHDSVAPRLSDASQNAKRELSYREICKIMGRNLRVIPHDDEPSTLREKVLGNRQGAGEQLERFDAQIQRPASNLGKAEEAIRK
jgi:hypothetical protein